jgi:1-acyl-sn-glycerol-3-phosphate acyltransferase
MVSRWIYLFIRAYVKMALYFYFNRIKVFGREHLAGGGPFLFAANHQNAFMDGLLIVVTNSFPVHFLIRADIFKKPWIIALLKFCNLMPVYRIRDGFSSLTKNQEQFDECIRLFLKKESVLIFPEGNHSDTRSLRPLSKGFTRIVFEAERQHPEMKLTVVPVGINYADHKAFNSRVSIYFGKPIPVSEYFKEPLPIQANLFKEKVEVEIKKLIAHIDDEKRYVEILTKLNATNPDYFDPLETNERIRQISNGETVARTERKTPILYTIFSVMKPLVWLVNFPVILSFQKFMSGIKDKVFTTSLRFGFGIFVVQLYYYIIIAVAAIWLGWWALAIYPFLLCSLKILRRPV